MNQDNNPSTSATSKAAYKFMTPKKEAVEEVKESNHPESVAPKDPPRKRKVSVSTNYTDTFLARYELASRQGLHLEKETIATIKRIVQLGDERLTVSGFVENVLKHHFEFYKEEVNRLHEENMRKPIQ